MTEFPPGAREDGWRGASKTMAAVREPVAQAAGTQDAPSVVASERRAGISSSMPENLLWASALFNLILCFVDTNITALSSLSVIATEAAILAAALLVPFTGKSRMPGRMDFLLILLLVSWLLLSIVRQSLELKLFRDVAIVPIFVLLGMASRGTTLHRHFFWLHMVVLGVALWEAISVESFVSIFSIADYFAHTRGSFNEDWWVDSGLYLSAVRPETRFLFPDLPIHRLSSVFLEPVSLGNYVIIATIWLAGFWRQIPRRMRIMAALATLLLLVGSDSRMASITCLAIVLIAPARRHIPSFAAILTAPIVIATMFFAVPILGLETGRDDFGGRIAHSVQVFRSFDLDHYAGLSLDQMAAVQDAGFAYIIMSQSLLVALIIWGCLFLRRLVTPDSQYLHLAVALYLALNLTVSWSIFSIKTAALLWFLLGRAIRDDLDATQDKVPATRRAATGAGSGAAGRPVHSGRLSSNST